MSEIDIIESIKRKDIFGPCFRSLDTRTVQLVLLKVAFGLPLSSDKEFLIAKQCLNYSKEDLKYLRRRRRSCKELVIIAGRRSGKSFLSALIAVYRAIFLDRSKFLSPGEKAMILLIANDRIQARIVFGYIQAFLHASPKTRRFILKEMSDEIHLRNDVIVMVKTASFRGLRGFTADCVIFDECAYFRDEYSANPDKELLAAALPCLATIPNSMLIMPTTPYMKRGIVSDYDEKFSGKFNEKTIVWKAPTTVLNPTISQEFVDEQIARDPEARSEWLAEYRKGLERFLSFEAVANCVMPGRFELPFIRENRPYKAFLDPSGGRQDSFTLGISHREKSGIVVLDCLREIRPPFSPKEATKELAAAIKSYGLNSATSDRYAGSWVNDGFREFGISIKNSELSKSQIYLEFMPQILSGQVELIDDRRLVGQLANLERRTRSGGHDLIDHGPSQHDDVANAAAGACVLNAPRHSGAKFMVSDSEMY